MNDHRPLPGLPPPTNAISIQTIVEYRCALGAIERPTKTLNDAIAAFDTIILTFARGLIPNQGTPQS